MTLTEQDATTTVFRDRRRRRAQRRAAEDRDERPPGGRRPASSRVLVLVALALLTLYSVAPVWWLIVSVTKDQRDLLYSNGLWFAELNFLDNLDQVFTYNDGIFVRWMGNSLLYAGVGAAVCTLISVAAGYSLSRFSWPGRQAAMAAVIGSFLIPGAMLTLPLYLLFAEVGLVDSVWAVLIPTFISPFSVYLAKVYVDGAIPEEIIEAARIDGAGEVRIFFQIVARMMTTGSATVFLLSFVSNWNQFFLPLTMLRGEDKWTLSLGLYYWNAKRDEAGTDLTALVLTGALLSIIPLALFMIAMQRYWRTGVTLGSLK
ncbi:carbohydrate ABC transporter permease [Streptomyces sp. MP131-18]|uniref:carbohydrate ABC transporter permease n=1 Tax=Streptomyces sp. MP131-18 TaxID=1857892 RepID=UPI00097CA11F|nr:carbohydrate ABC transporter permease [Streptomyces sp. MP131-18]ONK09758.1 L-arabinose transport system permease protein AraQ [Streptomyces sp. MP131-18]